MSKRRAEVDVFGLSLLDTITCGLGGAIILLVIVMSQIRPPSDQSVKEVNPLGIPEEGAKDVTVKAEVLSEGIGIYQIFLKFKTEFDAKKTYIIGNNLGYETFKILARPSQDGLFYNWYSYEFDFADSSKEFDFKIISRNLYVSGCMTLVTPMQVIRKDLRSKENEKIIFKRKKKRWDSNQLTEGCTF